MGRKHNTRVVRVTREKEVYWYDNAKEASIECSIPYVTLAVACNGAKVKYLDRLGWSFYFEADAPEWVKSKGLEVATESLETKLEAVKAQLETAKGDLAITESSITRTKQDIHTVEHLKEVVLKAIESTLTNFKDGLEVLEDTLIHNQEQVELKQFAINDLELEIAYYG